MTLPDDDPTHASPLSRWLPLALLAVAAAVTVATGAHRWFSFDAIALNKAHLEGFVKQHAWLALAAYVAAYIAIVALSIPGSLPMTIVAGLLFPFWVAAPAVVVSATAGATILFLIARSSFGDSLRRKAGTTGARLAEGIRKDAAAYMLFLRLVPLFPFALVNLAPALVGVPLRTYIWTTFVGILPASVAFTLAAASLGDVLDEQKEAIVACKAKGIGDCAVAFDPSMLVSPKLLIAFGALGVLSLTPVAAKMIYARRQEARDG